MSSEPAAATTCKIETKRLILRELREEDCEALLPVLGDAVAMRYYPHPFSQEEVEAFIRKQRGRYERDGVGLWAMALKTNGELIGDCGLARQEVDRESHFEVGYHLRRDHWHKGYATEAARACMAYAFAELEVERIISMIRPENAPSRAVAERNGMKVLKEVLWHGYQHCIYTLERAEFAARR